MDIQQKIITAGIKQIIAQKEIETIEDNQKLEQIDAILQEITEKELTIFANLIYLQDLKKSIDDQIIALITIIGE